MYCAYCGGKIEENEKFCRACGKPVNQKPKRRWGMLIVVCMVVICFGVVAAFGIRNKKDHQGSAAVEGKTVSEDIELLDKEEVSSSDSGEQLEKGVSLNEVLQTYYDYIVDGECDTEHYPRWTLAYVDNDDIPELFMAGSCEADGCLICCYDNGEVKATITSRSMLSYIPKKNLVLNPGGNMGYYYDYIYKIIDGEFKMVYTGQYWERGYEDGNYELDEEGNIILDYEWNGKSVTKEEYDAALQSIYNQDEALDSYEGMTFYEVEEVDSIFDFEE